MSANTPLADHLMIDNRATALLEQVVLGLDVSVEAVKENVEKALEDPRNLFLLPMVCDQRANGYAKAYSELSDFSHKLLSVRDNAYLIKMGYKMDIIMLKYQNRVNTVFGVYRKPFTKDLIMSLQFELKSILEDRQARKKREKKRGKEDGVAFS